MFLKIMVNLGTHSLGIIQGDSNAKKYRHTSKDSRIASQWPTLKPPQILPAQPCKSKAQVGQIKHNVLSSSSFLLTMTKTTHFLNTNVPGAEGACAKTSLHPGPYWGVVGNMEICVLYRDSKGIKFPSSLQRTNKEGTRHEF